MVIEVLPMIKSILLLSLLSIAAACGADTSTNPNPSNPDASGNPSPTDAAPGASFKIVTPDINIPAGAEQTHRFYTTYKGSEPVGVKRWSSTMTPGSHHMIVYFLNQAQTEGVSQGSCQGFAGGNVAVWTYSAQSIAAEAQMPDGVGMLVKAGQPMCIEMHYLNATDNALSAHVELNGDTYQSGTSYQQAAAYITYNTEINVPPGSTGTAGGTCAVPSNAKFFAISTHVHKRGVNTEVHDGSAMLFKSSDWEHPGVKSWTTPFYQFTSNQLTYRCDYNNTGANRVVTGNSAETDEMCMAVGYFFPATKSLICLNSALLN
jgi:Copper type II ascorbate-dependent monooxygenase, C-terminal domain